MRRGILLAPLFLAALTARADNFLTGQRLYEMLIDQDPFLRAQASGYVAGVADADNGLGPTKLGWCYRIPNGVKTQQVLKVVTTFLDRNVPKRALGAASLVHEALAGSYPCR